MQLLYTISISTMYDFHCHVFIHHLTAIIFKEKRKTLTVGNGGQSLGDVAGDGLPDEPGGGASCGAQHDVRGSELLAHQRVLAP